MADNLDMLIQELKNASFENQNFEQNFNFFAEELKNMPPAVQQQVVQAMKNSSGITKHIGSGTESAMQSAVANFQSQSKGDLNITVTRVTASINKPLPFVLFGNNDFLAKYNASLRNFTSQLAGITVTVTQDNNTGDVLFTYTEGDNTDVVRVSNSGNTPYASILAGQNNNYFKTKYFLYSMSDDSVTTTQIKNPIYFGLISTLGTQAQNQLNLRSRTQSWRFDKTRIEVVLPEQKISPDFTFSELIQPVAALEVGFDFFMSERIDLNKA